MLRAASPRRPRAASPASVPAHAATTAVASHPPFRRPISHPVKVPSRAGSPCRLAATSRTHLARRKSRRPTAALHHAHHNHHASNAAYSSSKMAAVQTLELSDGNVLFSFDEGDEAIPYSSSRHNSHYANESTSTIKNGLPEAHMPICPYAHMEDADKRQDHNSGDRSRESWGKTELESTGVRSNGLDIAEDYWNKPQGQTPALVMPAQQFSEAAASAKLEKRVKLLAAEVTEEISTLEVQVHDAFGVPISLEEKLEEANKMTNKFTLQLAKANKATNTAENQLQEVKHTSSTLEKDLQKSQEYAYRLQDLCERLAKEAGVTEHSVLVSPHERAARAKLQERVNLIAAEVTEANQVTEALAKKVREADEVTRMRAKHLQQTNEATSTIVKQLKEARAHADNLQAEKRALAAAEQQLPELASAKLEEKFVLLAADITEEISTLGKQLQEAQQHAYRLQNEKIALEATATRNFLLVPQFERKARAELEERVKFLSAEVAQNKRVSSTFQKQLHDANGVTSTLENQLQEANGATSTVERQLQDIQLYEDRLQVQKLALEATAREELEKERAKRTEFEGKLKMIERCERKARAEMEERVKVLSAEIAEANGLTSKLEKELKEANGQTSTLKEQLQVANGISSTIEKQLQDSDAARKTLEKELEEAQEYVKRLQEENLALEATVQHERAARAELDERVQLLSAQVAEANGVTSTLEQQLHEAHEHAARSARLQVQSQHSSAGNQLQEAQERMARLQAEKVAEISRRSLEKQNFEERLKRLEKQVIDQSHVISKQHAQLAEINNNGTRGLGGHPANQGARPPQPQRMQNGYHSTPSGPPQPQMIHNGYHSNPSGPPQPQIIHNGYHSTSAGPPQPQMIHNGYHSTPSVSNGYVRSNAVTVQTSTITQAIGLCADSLEL